MTPVNRRGLLLGLASALAAPAIVHAGNLMPVKPIPFPELPKTLADLMNDLYYGDGPSYISACHYWVEENGVICSRRITAGEFYAT